MNLLRLVLSFCTALILIFFICSPVTGCKKTVTITEHDTTVVPVHDTTHIHDTTVVIDTFYNLKSGLVAYYNFNGGSLKDSSGFNNDIIFNNASPATDRYGNVNSAYTFDGSTSYMKIANSESLNAGTITLFAIIKVNGFYSGLCGGNAIINKGMDDNINGLYLLRFSDASNSCSVSPDFSNESFYANIGDPGNRAGVSPTNIKVAKNKWYYLAYTFDGYTSNFYINGQLVESSQKSASFTPNNEPLFLGRMGSDTYPYYFNGIMDEVRIYSRALSIEEVKLLSK